MGCWGGNPLCLEQHCWHPLVRVGEAALHTQANVCKNAYHFPGVPGEPQDTLLLLLSSQLPGGKEVQFGGRGCCGWQVL